MLRAVLFVSGALLSLTILAAPSLGIAATRAPKVAAPGTPTDERILLMGQSNMVGRDKPTKDPRDSRVKAFLGGGWRVAAEPLNGGGYGPGTSFGLELVRDGYARTVKLIPCAVGSTAMKRWVPTGDLYKKCISKMRKSGKPATGVLFYQGESDSATLEDAEAWDERFTEMVNGLRRDTKHAGLPVVFAQLGSTDRPAPHWEAVNEVVKRSQSSVSLPGVSMIRTEDLPTFDGLHLTTPAQRVAGCRFAEEFARLRGFSVPDGGCPAPGT